MVRPRKLTIELSAKERATLEKGTRFGKWKPRKVKRAMVLLCADTSKQSGNRQDLLSDREIAEKVGISPSSVGNIRKRFQIKRLECLEELSRSGRPKIIDGEIEAQIIALACSDAPEGRSRWSLRLIADRLVTVVDELDDVSYTTIGKTLKKMNLNLG